MVVKRTTRSVGITLQKDKKQVIHLRAGNSGQERRLCLPLHPPLTESTSLTTITGTTPATIVVATVSAVVTRAVEATAEEDIHQTAEAMETAAVAMASAEATERMPMAVREELHPTDRTVRPTATDRPTDSAEATATTAMTEAREGHPMAVLPLVRVARHTGTGRLTDSAEAMATTPKVERREDHPMDRAVLHSARVVHPTDREEVTAAARKAAREGRHIQGNRPAATDSE